MSDSSLNPVPLPEMETSLHGLVPNAIRFAGQAHAADRWGGYPYLVHLALTAETTRRLGGDETAVATAWVHDVIEEHPEVSDQLAEQFPALVASVRVVSHRPDETYDDFITRIIHSGDPTELLVKMADMSVNLGSNPAEPGVRERYERNIGRLRDAVAVSR